MIRTLLTVLVLSLLSTPVLGEWKEMGNDPGGNTFYVDVDRIRKHGGYVYFWELTDYLKPKHGDLSVKIYIQGDCKLFWFMNLSYSFQKEPVGGGTGDVEKPVKQSQGWKYPSPTSPNEFILKSVCEYAK